MQVDQVGSHDHCAGPDVGADFEPGEAPTRDLPRGPGAGGVAAPAPPTATCPTCDGESGPDWAYCEWCGQELLAAASPTGTVVPPGEAAPPLPVQAARKPWVPRRLAVPVAALTGIGLLTAGALGYVETRRDLTQTRSTLTSTRQQLTDVTTKLSASEASLAKARTDLRSQIAKLQASQRELAGVRGTLGEAESRIDLQAGQIETLKSCLTGVSSALYYAGQYDGSAAVAALEAVEVSCDKAYSML